MRNTKKQYGLRKHENIRHPQDFTVIFQTGRFLRGRFFDIAYLFNHKRQVGFTASKRVRTAVGRNRIKRILREAYRLEKESFHECVQLIFIGRENILGAHLNDLREAMRKMAARINVIV